MNTQYMIATARNAEKLTEEVQSRINEGWIPQGGISITLASSPVFAQALILKANN